MQPIFRDSRRPILALLLVLASGGALGGMAAAAGQDDGPARCRIDTARNGGAVRLTALAEADAKVGGSYSFRVSGGGRGGGTNIRQGGAFEAAPGRDATLGTVTLNASGATYDVDLELVADGATIRCSKRIGAGN